MFDPERSAGVEPFFRDIPKNLTKAWEGIPERYVSVYHFTRPEALPEIGEKGIQHYTAVIPSERLSYYQRVKINIDRLFDQTAAELGIDHKRGGSVYASPEFMQEQLRMGKGNIPLEVKVDPQKVIIGDGRLVMAASMSWLRTPDGKTWLENHPEFIKASDRERFEKAQAEFPDDYVAYIRQYWQGAITLEAWNKLPTEERSKRFMLPEVLIEGGVASEFVRVKQD